MNKHLRTYIALYIVQLLAPDKRSPAAIPHRSRGGAAGSTPSAAPAAPQKVVIPFPEESENVTRWIVDQQFRKEQERLKIPLGKLKNDHENNIPVPSHYESLELCDYLLNNTPSSYCD